MSETTLWGASLPEVEEKPALPQLEQEEGDMRYGYK
jgi:hypothetical protein